jgi:hypothetical protein
MNYEVEFEYKVREGYVLITDLDENLSREEMELQALTEIKEVFDDVEDIEIKSMRKIN